MHLWSKGAPSFQVRSRDIHSRADDLAQVDVSFQIEIGIGFNTAGCADGSGAAGQVEFGKGLRQLLVMYIRWIDTDGRVVHMFMEEDEAGQQRLAAAVDDGGACGRRGGCCIADGGDDPAADDDGLVS